MKKLICFVVIIASLFLVSCEVGDVPVELETTADSICVTIVPTSPATEEISTESTTAASTTATTAPTPVISVPEDDVDISEIIPKIFSANNRSNNKSFLETDNMILLPGLDNNFNGVNITSYYDKSTGEIKPYCFDPDCDHNNVVQIGDTSYYSEKCIGSMIRWDLKMNGGKSKGPFYINERIYFTFFYRLYSCAENAEDLRVEIMFSDRFDVDMDIEMGISWQFAHMYADGDNIFFRRIDENGKVRQYRYDTASRELFDLTEKLEKEGKKRGITLYVDYVMDGVVYLVGYKNVTKEISLDMTPIYDSGEFVGNFVSDYDLETVESSEHGMPSIASGREVPAPCFTVDGGNVVRERSASDFGKTNLVLYTHDGRRKTLVHGIENALSKDIAIDEKNKNSITFLFINSKYLYYSLTEKKTINTVTLQNDVESDVINHTGGSIYRYEFETGNIKRVFQNDGFDWFVAVYFDEENGDVLFICDEYQITKHGYDYHTSEVLLKCKADENGTFELKESVK